MDEGKLTKPKAKWWSRPAARRVERGQESDEASVAAQERSPEGRGSEERVPDGGQISDGQISDGRMSADRALDDRTPEDRASDGRMVEGRESADVAPAPDATPGAPSGGANSPSTEGSPTGIEGSAAAAPVSEPHAAAAPEQAPRDADRPGGRLKPLHDPDPYGTPPYGEPGPWALAPPVQRPVATPAQGTPVPPTSGTPAQGTSVPAYAVPPTPAPPTAGAPAQGTPVPAYAVPPTPAPTPAAPTPAAPATGTPADGTPLQATPPHGTQPQPTPPHGTHPQQGAFAGQWQQYDPWRAPQAGPLLMPDGPAPARRPRRGRLFVAALVLALVAGGVGGGIGAYMERNGGISTVELPQAGKESKARAPESVAGIAASALPSVVTLHVSGGGSQGTGTGFVLDGKGHILTNNHVVEPAGDDGEVSVTFSGGEVAKAKVVGRDSGYDLAVVKVSGVSGLKPLPLGNSDNVQVGDPVVAIGAPFDLSNTVTSGIISAKERPITAGGDEGDGSDVSYVDALQTDAPINPGNSGGPLVDHKARVIGINSAIRSAGNGSDLEGGQSGSIGLGFAIPINQAKRVAEELINTGKATHPVIEVTLDTRYTGDGARVAKQGADGAPSVSPGGPGDKAGIEPGDVITEVDGQRVHSGEELIVKIRAHRPGDQLELTLERGGDEKTLSLELGAAGS
jgi:putative serine protease PepD